MSETPTPIRRAVTVVFALLVGGLHFVMPRVPRGPLGDLVTGYLIDVLLPAVLFLLVRLVPSPFTRHRAVPFVFVLLVGGVIETSQGLGIPLLGSTFDPLDYIAYTVGALLGLGIDALIMEQDKKRAK